MTEAQLVANTLRIQVDGAALAGDAERSVLQVVVDDHLHLPDMFAIWLQETDEMDVARQAQLKVGSKVTISASREAGAAPVALMTGEVTALEGEYRHASAPVLIVRGYDPAHRLMRGRESKMFRQVKYSDIARQVASEAGFEIGTIDDSSTQHEYVHQAGQTPWEFLKALAREIGFEVTFSEGKFHFRQPPPASAAPSGGDMVRSTAQDLVFGAGLEEFRPRITAAGQVAKVTVRGWDVTGKQDLTGQASAGTTAAELPDNPGSLAATFDNPEMVSGDRPLVTQGEVTAAAAAIAEQIGSAFAEATGISQGNPELRAGVAVNVTKVAAPFAGKYTLTHTRHVYDLRHGYRTHFEISGRQERSLLGLASSGGGGGAERGMPIQVGVVDNITDPNNQGRVRVRLPYGGPDFVTDWARTLAPGNGKDRGMTWLPEVGDEVLVAFEGGDVGFPIVLGGVWNGKDAPPNLQIENGVLQERAFVSRTGQKIVFSDKDDNLGIKVSSKDDSLLVHIDVTNKKILVTADNGGEVKLTSGGNFTIESQGSVKISGQSGVEISSQAQTKVSGSAGLNLESSGVTAVKGSQVSLG